jgi:N-acetylglucosamine malate deacetylase 2
MTTTTGRASAVLDQLCSGASINEMTIAIVAGHPDDEVVGMGGEFGLLKDAYFVHVTDGAPRNMIDAKAYGYNSRWSYAYARQCEFAAALAAAGIDQNRYIDIGLVAQEACRNFMHMVHELMEILMYLHADVVITHPYEGGHPDHDATALGVHAATTLMQRNGLVVPDILEFTSYHGRDGRMTSFEFLSDDGSSRTVELDETKKSLKKAILECFATQERRLKQFPIEVERFRPAPQYDFTQPPHEGRLYYERFDFGTTGQEWCRHAQQALASLGITEAV